jgi:methyl coenzyme M reductase gamma subunit
MKPFPSKMILLSVSTGAMLALQSLPALASSLEDIDFANLNSTQGFSINGATVGEFSGNSVSSAGDINNDGIQDLIIGAYYASPSGRRGAGSSYVIYGKTGGYDAPIDLASLSNTQGFRINGAAATDYSGVSVSSAGDINSDGIHDLLIGAYYADPSGRQDAGSTYVIYGRAGGYDAPIDLASLSNTQGFRINGAVAVDRSGSSVSSAGDINSDGIHDLIIGAYFADPSGHTGAGSSYVIYGKAGGYDAPIDLASLSNTQGFRIDGAAASEYSGISVSSAGDINSDGISDLIIGANGADPSGRQDAGSSYIIYGKAGGYNAPIDLASLSNTQGFRIDGAAASDNSGRSVSSAGDTNNDGISDLIIGAHYASPLGRTNAGSIYVIYGKAGGYDAPIDLASLSNTQGFRINGAAAGDQSGYSVSSAGDINSDGISDLIIGAEYADSAGRTGAGSSYIIYGKAGGYNAPIDLASLSNTQGFKVNGAAAGDTSGHSVSSAGDINNDGISDLIVGAYYADPYGRFDAGSSYVIYGRSAASPSPSASPSASPSSSPSPSPSASPSYSSASTHNVPWYSPANWLSSLREWWNTQEDIDTNLPYVNEMLDIKSQINQASQLSSDRWFQFSLEDLTEDMNLILKNPQAIQKDTIKDMKKRLIGIKKDFLYEQAPQLNGLFADHVQLSPLKDPMVALNPSSASLTYRGFAPPMLTK